MKNLLRILALFLVLFVVSCTKNDMASDEVDSPSSEATGEYTTMDGIRKSGGTSGGQGNAGGEAGVVTAAEWNDLVEWDFWNNLLNENEFFEKQKYWGFYTDKRISVSLFKDKKKTPAVDIYLELRRGKSKKAIWSARTDNMGKAEFWVGLFQEDSEKPNDLSIWANDKLVSTNVKFYEEGVNEIYIRQTWKRQEPNKVELAFVVDATGSMGDEMAFLKEDLKSVIDKIKAGNSAININTGAVFYRDKKDEYVTKYSGFTNDLSKTLKFINQQNAGGGGDYPEAVDTALKVALSELQWSEYSKTRILFLLLDAPPHYEPEVVERIHKYTTELAKKGIKVIPITASGIDKETEFLMRFMAISTNGTYVFITNDSGVGNDHLKASVGKYQVEKLNSLLVRLIEKYTK